MLLSGVLVQENIDLKPYKVDDKYFVARYPIVDYKKRYFDEPLCEVQQSLI